jgi:hypothetical protein
MGCSSTQIKIDGKIIKQETINLEISDNFKTKELNQAQALIHLITNIRNNIIYEYDNIIYITGGCLFKNPSITHCTKCILFKICSECQGNISNAEFEFKEDPPFLKIKFEKFTENTNNIIKQFFDFIIKLRDFKVLMKQIDKETPKLMYIVFENNNKISKENIEKINRAILLFKDLNKLRSNILVEYKNQIYELVINNKSFLEQINKIGEIAYKNNITDIYEITMLFKDNIIGDEENTSNFRREEYDMYNSIKEAKSIMEKKLRNEKVEDIDTSLYNFSFKRTMSCDTFG